MTPDTKSWNDVWRMITRTNFRKLAWDVDSLSTPPSTEAENSTFKLSSRLHAVKRRPQWLHQAAWHLGHESWLTPRDLFRREIWMQKDMLLWAVAWSGHAHSNDRGEENASNRCYVWEEFGQLEPGRGPKGAQGRCTNSRETPRSPPPLPPDSWAHKFQRPLQSQERAGLCLLQLVLLHTWNICWISLPLAGDKSHR